MNLTNLTPHAITLRADGTDTGQRYPLDTTYSEWARSDFAVAGSPEFILANAESILYAIFLTRPPQTRQ